MVHKERCTKCNGNKFVRISTRDGHSKNTPCPHCSGNGYRIKVIAPPR